jgi:Flp pilus assembly protein TadG
MKLACAILSRHALRRDIRGISAVEFALVLPFLVLLYLGGYQLSDAIAAQRKVTTTTRAIVDLTSRYTTVTNADLDMILNASRQIMAPYSTSTASMTISQISIDATGKGTVDWSRPFQGTGLLVGSTFDVPTEIQQPNTTILVASTSYLYVPIVARTLLGDIPMREQIIMSPRASNSIPLKAS